MLMCGFHASSIRQSYKKLFSILREKCLYQSHLARVWGDPTLKHALNNVITILKHWLSYKSGPVIWRGDLTVLKTHIQADSNSGQWRILCRIRLSYWYYRYWWCGAILQKWFLSKGNQNMGRPLPSTHAYLSHVSWYLKSALLLWLFRGESSYLEDGPLYCSKRTDHFKKCELIWFQYSARWTASHNRHYNGILLEIQLRYS